MSKSQQTEALLNKISEIANEYKKLTQELSTESIVSDHKKASKIAARRAAISSIANGFKKVESIKNQILEYESILEDNEDAEFKEIAKEELPLIKKNYENELEILKTKLLTADDDAVSKIIIEVRAGVGGDEAMLWASDLLEMYEKYCTKKYWKIERLEFVSGEIGGCRHSILSIKGESVWAHLGYESGTHQVKRVPATETQGRVHTSTATVAVLAEPEEIELKLDRNDVKEMITTSTGPGGQNVNKVATAVHLIHEPTGVEVRMQDTKSQSQNREKAWQLLRARLFQKQKQEADDARAKERANLIGSGSRAEKIRTYRYKDSKVVDSRITGAHNLDTIMSGDLEPLIKSLRAKDAAQRIANFS